MAEFNESVIAAQGLEPGVEQKVEVDTGNPAAYSSSDEKSAASESVADEKETAEETVKKSAETQEDTAVETKTEANADNETETAEADNETETGSEKQKEAPKKPPKGYVPIQALREVRATVAELRAQVKALEDQAGTNKSTQSTETNFMGFKELSESDEKALFVEDPAAGIEYLNQKMKVMAARTAEAQVKYRDEQELERARLELEKVAPDIFENDEVQEEFRTAAETHGLDESAFYLTDPKTRVILPSGETRYLGTDAAKVLSLVAALVKGEKSSVALKRPTTKSVRKIPSTKETPSIKGRVYTPAEFAKLSGPEQHRYLSGE